MCFGLNLRSKLAPVESDMLTQILCTSAESKRLLIPEPPLIPDTHSFKMVSSFCIC